MFGFGNAPLRAAKQEAVCSQLVVLAVLEDSFSIAKVIQDSYPLSHSIPLCAGIQSAATRESEVRLLFRTGSVEPFRQFALWAKRLQVSPLCGAMWTRKSRYAHRAFRNAFVHEATKSHGVRSRPLNKHV